MFDQRPLSLGGGPLEQVADDEQAEAGSTWLSLFQLMPDQGQHWLLMKHLTDNCWASLQRKVLEESKYITEEVVFPLRLPRTQSQAVRH